MKASNSLCYVIFFLFLIGNASQADVTKTFRGNTLTIKSDGVSDFVSLRSNVQGEVIVVVNFDLPVIYTNVNDIKISMGRGADTLSCIQVNIAGNLTVDMGGDLGDQCFCAGCFVADLNIQGSSDIQIGSCLVRGRLTLTAGRSFDLDLDGFTQSIVDSWVGERTTINGSSSDDGLYMLNCWIGPRVIKLGRGNDTAVLRNNSVSGEHNIDGGPGFDFLGETEFSVSGRTIRRNVESIVF